MPSGPSLLSRRILALVRDEWEDMEEFMGRAMPLVPPGKALRVYQANRAKHDSRRDERIASGKPPGQRKPEPSTAKKQEYGARCVVNDLLNNMRGRALVEVEAVGTRRERRIRRSYERQYAHHCCLHGGSCRGDGSGDEPDPRTAAPEDDPLPDLIDRVLESRRQRESGPPPGGYLGIAGIREVRPGEIDRLLREVG